VPKHEWKQNIKICPKTGKPINQVHEHGQENGHTRKWYPRWLFPITGLAALLWFLIRVIPKPSRANYPCQRAAFPLASAFIAWLAGVLGGVAILRKVRAKFAGRYITAALSVLVLVIAGIWSVYLLPSNASALTPIQLPASKVAIVQSSQANANDIQYDEIKTMVQNAVNLAGGFTGVIKDGDVVVIKPNLVSKTDYTNPDPAGSGKPLSTETNGVCTDWRVTKAVVELVRQVNPSGKIYVMEGSSAATQDIMNALNYTSSYIPGVDRFIPIETDSGAWQDTASPGLVKVGLPDGLLHTEYYMNRKYKEANVVISLPCMKNHWSAAVSGGIKNVGIGATPANIYGTSSTDPSRNNMVAHDSTAGNLHKWIRDFYKCRPVNFVIMDGLQGIQNGPTPSYLVSGATDIAKEQMNMRLILAGKDPVAVDTIESLLMGWDPQSVGYLGYLNNDSLGNLDTACITVVGKKVDEVRKDFAGRIPPAGGAKITDKTPPGLALNSLFVQGSTLSLSLTAASETVKVELYIDGQLKEPAILTNFGNIMLDISNLSGGSHSLAVEAYDRFLNRSEQTTTFNNTANNIYFVPRAAQTPVIDGSGNDSCWAQASWRDINYLWLGTAPGATDFSGRYKLVWTPERLYYLIEITDNVLSAPYTNHLDGNHYNNDCVELFIDENRSGGDHTYNYNAFAYHIHLNYDMVDLDTQGSQRLYNDHATIIRTQNGNLYTWEIALKVFPDTYNENSTANQPVILNAGKLLGFGVAYNDNDGGATRESFIGSFDIPGTDKNVAWKDASVFAGLQLIDTNITPAPTIRPSATPTPVVTPTPGRTATPVRTATPRRTVTPRLTATPVRTATPVATVTPMVTATPVPITGTIKVQFYNQSTAATSNQIYLNVKLINTGSSAVALSNVKIRYYYTIDGAQTQNFYCDYSPAGSSNLSATFVTMATAKTGADTYVEIGFTTGAGSLAANGGNTTIQARVAKSNWTNYTQTNDYSFNSTATTFADWTKVTGYVSGALQWGAEP
jgi:uncharacterized protein (DUF362 family)